MGLLHGDQRFVLLALLLLALCAVPGRGQLPPPGANHYPEKAIHSGWAAKWIWATPGGLERNAHVYFRKEFELASKPPVPVTVKVSAATHYVLYVNGEKAGFGPPISDQRYHYFDSRDISPYLRAGKNAVAVLVHSLAEKTEDYHGGRGLFLLEGSIPDGDTTVVLDTDRQWKSLRSDAWPSDAPRQSMQLGFVEIVDLRKEPIGWTEAGFDSSQWPDALEIGAPPQGGYENLVARDLGDFDERFQRPTAVVRVAEVARAAADPIPAKQVQAESLLPPRSVQFRATDSLVSPGGNAVIVTPEPDRDAVLVLDMGQMIIGCPYLEVEGPAGAVIDVSVSEYLRDGRVLAARRITPTQWTYLTSRIILRDGRQHWQHEDYSGYRFIQLTIRGARRPLTIKKAGSVLRNYRYRGEATFRSSDPLLDRIFEIAKNSHKVNTHWGYCGSSWREHAMWSDLVWPTTSIVVFGDQPLLSYFLHQITLSQNEQGRLGFPYPGTQGVELPEQTMWLADVLQNSYAHFGDRQLLADLFPTFQRANTWFQKQLGPHGLLKVTTDWDIWLVVDWGYPQGTMNLSFGTAQAEMNVGSHGEPGGEQYAHGAKADRGELATLNMIYYRFLRSCERIGEVLGEQTARDEFRKQADALLNTINDTFFDSRQSRYYEFPGKRFPSVFASAQAVVYDVVPEKHRRAVFDFAIGDDLRVGKASPWFSSTALEAFAKAGRHEDAVRSIKRYWGEMLAKGATTFWEQWDYLNPDVQPLPGYTPEMWAQTITYSSGPASYLVEHVLGVQPLAPGFSETLIAPHFSGLTYAEGSAPTPMGDIRVKWQQYAPSGGTEFYFEVPSGMTARLRLPYSAKQPRVEVDGQLVYDGSTATPNARVKDVQRREDTLELGLLAGHYYITTR